MADVSINSTAACAQYYSLTALGPSEEAQRESVQLHEMKPTKSANALITTLALNLLR